MSFSMASQGRKFHGKYAKVLLMTSPPSLLLELARRYSWWSAPEETVVSNLPRLVAQVMEMGTWDDAHALLDSLGAEPFREVLRQPPPGTLSPKSWAFWHYRLGLGEAPEYPAGRKIPLEA